MEAQANTDAPVIENRGDEKLVGGQGFSVTDLLTVLISLAVLGSFFFLPWLDRPTVTPNFPGVLTLVGEPVNSLLAYSNRVEVSTGNVFLSDTFQTWFSVSTNSYTGWGLLSDSYYTESVTITPLFLLLGGIGGLILGLIGLTQPKWRVLARILMLIAGAVGALYYIFFFGKYTPSLVQDSLNIGFWIGLFGIVFLFIQIVLPRPIPARVRTEKVVTMSVEGVVNLRGAKNMSGESLYTKAFRRLRRDYLTLTMIFVLALMVIFSLSAPLMEQALNVSYRDTRPPDFLPMDSGKYLLGTDDLGRDHLTRLAYGGQISLAIAFSAAVLSLVIGVSMGILTGYYGGILDDIIMWFITTLNSIPQLFLLIIIAAVLDPGPEGLILVLGFLGWTGTTRLVRGETLGLREREYVISARALGASDVRIMFSHILPNLISIVVVTLAIDIGALLLTEAGLSFLGLGVQPPTPTWGNMLSNSQTFFTKGGHLVIFPGLLISITVLSLYVIGDGVRDAFDPRTND
ncbi:MAG: ABC transporter permease [Chloroflexota bacterium]